MDAEVAVIGAGVVGCATALALARRGVDPLLLEAEPEPGLAASGTNSGVLHTGFDSPPGELETDLILRAAELRDPLLEALGVPVLRCGAVIEPRSEADREAIEVLTRNARANRVEVASGADGSLAVPGESVTDPVALTLALAAGAARHGAAVRTRFAVVDAKRAGSVLTLVGADGGAVTCRLAVNCAGLGAGSVARLLGDDSFDVYPRKGEFLVFDQAEGRPLEQVLLPVPSAGTKGVLVFPTLDGKVVAGPTAVDQEDPSDWSVRDSAKAEIVPRAAAMLPWLAEASPISAYAGLRPAGRGCNYVVERSAACEALVNVAAIRSTGLTASPALAERACALLADAGLELGPEQELRPADAPPQPSYRGPWWRRTAEYRGSGRG